MSQTQRIVFDEHVLNQYKMRTKYKTCNQYRNTVQNVTDTNDWIWQVHFEPMQNVFDKCILNQCKIITTAKCVTNTEILSKMLQTQRIVFWLYLTTNTEILSKNCPKMSQTQRIVFDKHVFEPIQNVNQSKCEERHVILNPYKSQYKSMKPRQNCEPINTQKVQRLAQPSRQRHLPRCTRKAKEDQA